MRVAVVTLLAIVIGTSRAYATAYDVEVIDANPSLPAQTVVTDINDKGQVAGYFYDGTGLRGFIDTGGVISVIDVPGYSRFMITGINNLGDVVGLASNSEFGGGPGVEISGGVVKFLTVPQYALDVNYSGGFYLPVFTPQAINDAGQIVGAVSGITAVITDTSVHAIPVPFGTTLQYVDINNLGQVLAGFISYDGVTRTQSFGTYIYSDGNLRTPSVTINSFSGSGFNDVGQIVSRTASLFQGVLGPLPITNQTYNPLRINDSGQIAGAYYDSTPYSFNVRSFIATPIVDVPEPTSGAVMVLGFAAVIGSRRRRSLPSAPLPGRVVADGVEAGGAAEGGEADAGGFETAVVG